MYGFNELKRKLTKTLTNVARVWGQPVVTWGLRKSKTVVKTMVSHDDQHRHHCHYKHHHEHHKHHHVIHDIIMITKDSIMNIMNIVTSS